VGRVPLSNAPCGVPPYRLTLISLEGIQTVVWRGGPHIPSTYARRIIQAFEQGKDWTLVELHCELNEDHELYLAVLGYLPSGLRRQWGEIVARENDSIPMP
jgi:hypothetical protein